MPVDLLHPGNTYKSQDVFFKHCKKTRLSQRRRLFKSVQWLEEHFSGEDVIITKHTAGCSYSDVEFCGVCTFQAVLRDPGQATKWSWAFCEKDFHKLFVLTHLVERCAELDTQIALGLIMPLRQDVQGYRVTQKGKKWMEENLR